MADVKVSMPFSVPASQVWDKIGSFNALPDWHPAVERSELEDGGTRRRLHLVGGGEILEQLDQEFPQVGIGSYPQWDHDEIKVIVTFDGGDVAEVDAARSRLLASLGSDGSIDELVLAPFLS